MDLKTNWIAVILCVGLMVRSSVAALKKCYSCRGQAIVNSNCFDPFNANGITEHNFCAGSCRKIHSVSGTGGYIERLCMMSEFPEDCSREGDDSNYIETCYCNTDNCNGSHRQSRAQFASVASGLSLTMNSSLFGTTVLMFCLISMGSVTVATICYSCHAQENINKECFHPFNKDGEGVKLSSFCSGACRKIHSVSGTGEFIERLCMNDDHPEGCTKTGGYTNYIEVCYCNSDYCNGSHRKHTHSLAVLAGLAAAFFCLIRTLVM
ncbi:hypothetical protein BV898_13753 [Hypsibius exemplaris]|uniref:Protein sleepless n=1 Tax=Hypsibius exemplaris TaxID=2072580 RepID=A0A1W0W9W8_HYPEX|nr:hypothetical protein BV898_13753 [Hypsibius exemplaris]